MGKRKKTLVSGRTRTFRNSNFLEKSKPPTPLLIFDMSSEVSVLKGKEKYTVAIYVDSNERLIKLTF